jgi:hypothetical protein
MNSRKCMLFYGNGNADHRVGTCFFIHKGLISAVKRAEYVSDRMSYITQRGHWRDIIVLNVHAPTEDTYHIQILLGDFNAKVGREDTSKPTIKLGMTMMGLE